MTDILEICARAMHGSRPQVDDWDSEQQSVKDIYLADARACLATLAENVSKEMAEAGADYGPIGCCNLDEKDARSVFTAMINAAIGEKP